MTMTSTCPEHGVWRAWLDQEQYDPQLDEHLATCATCTETVRELRANAATASQAVRSVGPAQLWSTEDTLLARERLAWRQRGSAPAASAEQPVAAAQKAPGLLLRIPTPWRIAVSGLAAALALSVLVGFTDEGRTAAAAFLSQFRSQ